MHQVVKCVQQRLLKTPISGQREKDSFCLNSILRAFFATQDDTSIEIPLDSCYLSLNKDSKIVGICQRKI
jgi:hypothetical protein